MTKRTGSVARFVVVARAMPLALFTASIGLVALAGCGGSGSMAPAAMPTFTPGPGTYTTSQTVTIASSTAGSVLYCTTDDTTPSASSPQCSEPMTISKSETVSAIAIAPGQSPSPVATAAYTINLPSAAAPVFSPAAGTYATAQSVTITDTIGGALIYYTTDGSTPTASSTPYSGPITVSSTETINAIAVASDYSRSAEATALYAIDPPAPTPTIGGPGGSTTTTYGVPLLVTLADSDPNAIIYYAINAPATSASTLYTGPIAVLMTETVNSVAIDSTGGYSQSVMSSQSFTVSDPPPVFSQPSGNITSGTQIAITDADPVATIYYSLGTSAQSPSTLYTGPIAVTGSEAINAVAIDTVNNYAQSIQSSASYTVPSQTPTPTILSSGGSSATYPSSLSVTITDSDPNAQIYYTTDGSTPGQTHGSQYAGPLTVSQTETISAIAVDVSGGNSASSPASQQLTIVEAAPVFSQPAGAVASGAQVSVTDADPRATIYYTTNGSAATTAATLYTGPISITSAEAINAVAVDTNAGTMYYQSTDASAAYTLQAPAPTPAIASAGVTSATYPSRITATISDTDGTATIYYTTDGSTPSATHGSQYGGPITVSSTETITAVAIDSSHALAGSAAASQLFTITEATPTIAPAAGPVTAGTQVTITDADPGAAIYYTTNGNPATTASTLYTGPFTIASAETINAVAVNANPTANYVQSMDASTVYTLQAPTPVIASANGTSTIYPGSLTVTITDSDATAAIYYTTDGSNPSASNGTQYTAPFRVSGTETVAAVAIDSPHGYGASAIASQLFTVTESTPTFSPAAGTVSSGAQVTITDTDPAATIFYTTNGSQATTASTRYTGPFAVTAPETINAVAINTVPSANYALSADASAIYSVQVPTPAITSSGGTSATYPANLSVSIGDSDTNATVNYTTDGSTPTATHGTPYAGPFIVSSTETVMAIALDAPHGFAASSTAAQLFSVVEASPSISPASGTISSGTQVTMSDADPGAAIYYTTNGNQATTSSTRYTGPITVTASETVNAVAVDTSFGAGYTQSLDTSAVYNLSGSAPVPVISAAGGTSTTYPGTLPVTIADSDTNAAIYYTTDGSGPSVTHGTLYSGAFNVASTETITAVAVDLNHGYSNSAAASQSFTVAEARPIIAPAAGVVASGTQVTISDADPGATIYYTTNGSPANTSSTRYTGSFTITTTETVNAIAIDTVTTSDYVQSVDASAAYTIQSPAPTPAIVSAGGTSATYPSTISVTLSDTDSTATIYYTTDGSTPSATHGSQYSGGITVSSTETITAVATDASHGFTGSAAASQLFTITEATPTIAPAAGAVASGTQVTITDADPGAIIYYTTNGSAATTSSARYTAAFTITTAETVNAIAIDTVTTNDYVQSVDASAAYTIQSPAPTPAIVSVSGTSATYPSTLSVTLSDTDSTATIYYTTDGSTPSATHGSQYSGAITVSSTETITAVAIDLSHGFTASASASQLFTIAEATPTIAPASGAVASGTQVTIADADSHAVIYYTTNGSPATTSSTLYTGFITLSAAETINAVAIDTAANYTVSQDASAAYTIQAAATPTPSISSASGTSITYPSSFSVTITDTDTQASIYYTTDGSTPSATNGTQYTSGNPFTVTSTETVSAIAIDASTSSTVATQFFTVQEAEPQFSPPAGDVASGASVTITDVDPGATIYYTTNGSPATTSSTQYTSPISVTSATTINAVAINTAAGANYTLSQDASAAYALCPAHSVCGSVMSGSLPINGATVKLFAAGKTGYGAGATALTTTPSTVITNAAGGFSFTLPTCPSAPGDQLYLVATGGSTSGGSSEASIALMLTLGTCSKLASVTSVTINEVTTVASAYALSGFATSNGSGAGILVGAPAPSASCTLAQVGNSTCNYTGLVNAFRTVNNLVSTTSGTPLTITEFYSGSDTHNPNGWSSSYGDTQAPYPNCSSSPSVSNCLSYDNAVPSDDPRTGLPFSATSYQGLNTSLVPFQRLNTLGNVLASCVEEPGNCAGLASLTNGATDTLQAALYIARNPGKWSGTAGLYGQIAQPATAFTPPYGDGTIKTTLTSEPNDWTLAISFTGGGLGINPVVDSTDALANQTLAIDIAGNVWVTAVPEAPMGQPLLSSGATGMVAGFDPIGEALTPATSLVSGSVAVDSTNNLPYSTFGGFGPDHSYSGSLGILGQPSWLAIDTLSPEHLWTSSNEGGADQFDDGPVQLSASRTIAPGNTGSLSASLIGPRSSGHTSIFYGDMAIDGTGLWEMSSDGTLTYNDSNGQYVGAISLGLGYSSGNIGLAFDSLGNIWISDGGSSQVVETSTSNNTGAPGGTYNNVYASPIAIDTFAAGTSGNMYACNANQNGYLVLNASNATSPVNTFNTSNSRCGAFLTVDGAGNIWSYGGAVPASAQQALDEVTPAGTQISPDTGFTATSTAEQTTTGLTTINSATNTGAEGGGIAIDPSGNLWFLNGQAGAQGSTYLPTNALVEFVGVAAPTVTPTALATQNSAQGTKP